MTIKQELLQRLQAAREEAIAGGGADRIAKHHAKGALTARERFAALFEPETFLEWGMHVQHGCHDFGMQDKKLPGDGVITGIGQVDGRSVAGFAHDFTVGGGALGQRHAKKICDIMDYAADCGLPFVAINDSGGARIQEGVDSLSGYGQVFYRNVQLSGLVPQIAIIAGSCAGGAAYSPALMDFLIMTRDNASMFICGPAVIKAATGVETTMEEIGGAAANATISGNVHFIAENDEHALDLVKELLSYLPSNNLDTPPHRPTPQISIEPDPKMNDLVPEDPKGMLDMLPIIERIVDEGRFLQVHEKYATSLMVGFARIDGIVVGVVANQPKVKAGTLDIDASDKGARFIRFCNAFNIPLVTLVDVPGFLPGVQQEQGGIIRHGAKMLFAYSAATVPKLTLIIRKAYGGAYLAMCSRDVGADFVYAWPTAEIAVMGAEGATSVLYRREIEAAEDQKAKRAELVKLYHDQFASPYMAASRGMITDVIDPAVTRGTLSLALRSTLQKSETRPPKKHGLIPL